MNNEQSVCLRVFADAAWIPLAKGVAEHSGHVFGLNRGKTLRLTMGVEEVLAYLAKVHPGVLLNLALHPRPSHVDAVFSFAVGDADLWAMNLTASGMDWTGDQSQAMGLLLAARMSDAMDVRRSGREVVLRLSVDQVYPVLEKRPAERFAARGALRIEPAVDPAWIKKACSLVCGLYADEWIPSGFDTPGKIVDRLREGELWGAVALDEGSRVCGFMVWEHTLSSVSFCGPYVFVSDPRPAAHALTEHMLRVVARSSVSAVLSRLATEELPRVEFELLGSLPWSTADGRERSLPVWYRGLAEDSGLSVWAHPVVEGFLRSYYEQHFLARDLMMTADQGEHVGARSVFATVFRPEISQALLTPMLDGDDVDSTVRAHVDLLSAEGYRNILAHIDLGHSWQALLFPVLSANGFQPQLVLPHAGLADIVVLRHV